MSMSLYRFLPLLTIKPKERGKETKDEQVKNAETLNFSIKVILLTYYNAIYYHISLSLAVRYSYGSNKSNMYSCHYFSSFFTAPRLPASDVQRHDMTWNIME